jgi:hypothetical protein
MEHLFKTLKDAVSISFEDRKTLEIIPVCKRRGAEAEIYLRPLPENKNTDLRLLCARADDTRNKIPCRADICLQPVSAFVRRVPEIQR